MYIFVSKCLSMWFPCAYECLQRPEGVESIAARIIDSAKTVQILFNELKYIKDTN